MEASDLIKLLIATDDEAYIFMGGTEEQWFDALESGYFATEYRRLESCCMAWLDMPILIVPPPADGRSINVLFNG